jgi:hypothetical protein
MGECMKPYNFKTKLWRYPSASAAWYFLSIPKKESTAIKTMVKKKKGWGSIRVKATIGKTMWETSIFPSKDNGGYILPIKAAVRYKEGIEDGDTVSYKISVM